MQMTHYTRRPETRAQIRATAYNAPSATRPHQLDTPPAPQYPHGGRTNRIFRRADEGRT